MFKLSSASEAKLQGVHSDLVRVVRRAIQLTDIDFRITEGLRTVERQRQLVAEKKSKTMKSRHLTGHAIDFVALPGNKVSWETRHYATIAEAFFKAADELKVPIRWGGTWKNTTAGWQTTSFFDGPHIELSASKYP